MSFDESGEAVLTPSYTNFPRYKNDYFDACYDKAIHAIEQDSAIYYYLKADSTLIADAALVPIYYGQNIRLIQSNVHAFPINSMEYRDLSRVFLSKK